MELGGNFKVEELDFNPHLPLKKYTCQKLKDWSY
jgi:hypothetical protein